MGLASACFTNGAKRNPRAAERAVRLFGAEEKLREVLGTPLPPADLEEYNRHVASVRGKLDDATFAGLWAEGRAMTGVRG